MGECVSACVWVGGLVSGCVYFSSGTYDSCKPVFF